MCNGLKLKAPAIDIHAQQAVSYTGAHVSSTVYSHAQAAQAAATKQAERFAIRFLLSLPPFCRAPVSFRQACGCSDTQL
jgi:hypothetical protein